MRCRTVLLVLALIPGLSVAACTGGSTTVHPTGVRSAAGSDRTATPPPKFTGVQHPLPSGTATANNPGLYQNVAFTGCAATAHGWAGTGTLRNPGDMRVQATILVLLPTPRPGPSTPPSPRSTSRPARAVTGVRAGTSPPRGTRCVVRAVS